MLLGGGREEKTKEQQPVWLFLTVQHQSLLSNRRGTHSQVSDEQQRKIPWAPRVVLEEREVTIPASLSSRLVLVQPCEGERGSISHRSISFAFGCCPGGRFPGEDRVRPRRGAELQVRVTRYPSLPLLHHPPLTLPSPSLSPPSPILIEHLRSAQRPQLQDASRRRRALPIHRSRSTGDVQL